MPLYGTKVPLPQPPNRESSLTSQVSCTPFVFIAVKTRAWTLKSFVSRTAGSLACTILVAARLLYLHRTPPATPRPPHSWDRRRGILRAPKFVLSASSAGFPQRFWTSTFAAIRQPRKPTVFSSIPRSLSSGGHTLGPSALDTQCG